MLTQQASSATASRRIARLFLVTAVATTAFLAGVVVVGLDLANNGVLVGGIFGGLAAGIYLIARPSHERAFNLMILTLPFISGMAIDIGGNLRVPYYFAVLALLLGIYQHRLRAPKVDVAFLLLAAFTAYAVLSAVLALRMENVTTIPGTGFRGSAYRPIIQSGQLLLMLTFFYLTLNYVISLDRLRRLSKLFFWSAVIVTAYGLYEVTAAVTPLPFVSINLPDPVRHSAREMAVTIAGVTVPRPKSVVDEPKFLAVFLLTIIPLCVAMIRSDERKRGSWIKWGAVGLFAVLFMLASSRAALAAGAVMLGAAMLLMPTIKQRLRLIVSLVVVYGILALLVFPLLGGGGDLGQPLAFYSDYIDKAGGRQGFSKIQGKRQGFSGMPLRVFQQDPVFGVGFGNYPHAYNRVLNVQGKDLDRYSAGGVYSLYLRLLAEVGIVGTALFCLFVGVVMCNLIRVMRRGADPRLRPFALATFCAVLGVLVLYIWTERITTDGYLWALLAMGVAIGRLGRNTSARGPIPATPAEVSQGAR